MHANDTHLNLLDRSTPVDFLPLPPDKGAMTTPAAQDIVGAHDAKTNLARLLDRVEQGASIVITRHGTPIARLVPYVEPIDRDRVREAIEGIRRIAAKQTLGPDLTVEDLINEGRP